MSGRFPWIRASGLGVSLIGFLITRVFVAETLQMDGSLVVTLVSLVPLLVGLGLTVFGVALAIGPFSGQYVLNVARWCVIGTVGMFSILLFTLSGPLLTEGGSVLLEDRARLITANVLLSGAVGGAFVGDRAATNRRYRQEVIRQANRGRVLTRLLRHEILNAATIIDGYARQIGDRDAAPRTAIRDETERITETINEVERIADDPGKSRQIEIGKLVDTEVTRFQERFPKTDISVSSPEGTVLIDADERAEIVVYELLENACDQADVTRVEIDVSMENGFINLTIRDDGAGLPDEQRGLLESRTFPEYDDPSAGFGLQIIRMLVSKFGGRIQVSDGLAENGTSIIVSFPRHDVDNTLQESISIALSKLVLSIGAGIVAGVVMGVYFVLATDQLPVIGALYGVENPLIGWITHLFHSVVFALLFAAGVFHHSLNSITQRPLGLIGAAIGWGAVLWLFAAGIIMPFWLRVIGESAMFPTLSPPGLISHLLWGVSLGLTIIGTRVLYRN